MDLMLPTSSWGYFDKIYYSLKLVWTENPKLKKVFQSFTKEDGSVWADLTEEGLDEKLLLRPDGTSVYDTGYWHRCFALCRL